jgi:hypothetical protein
MILGLVLLGLLVCMGLCLYVILTLDKDMEGY